MPKLWCVKCEASTMLKSEWREKIPLAARAYLTGLKLRIYYCSECGFIELFYGDEKKVD